jgi:hypothetical protein
MTQGIHPIGGNLEMRYRNALALVLTTLLVLATAIASETKAKSQATAAKTMKTHVASGKITSLTDDGLVLSRKVKGKAEETTFVLTSSTQREGNLENGAKVAVHYKTEGGQNIATSVKVYPAKQMAAKTSKP